MDKFAMFLLSVLVVGLVRVTDGLHRKQLDQKEEIRRLREKLRKRCDHQQNFIDSLRVDVSKLLRR